MMGMMSFSLLRNLEFEWLEQNSNFLFINCMVFLVSSASTLGRAFLTAISGGKISYVNMDIISVNGKFTLYYMNKFVQMQ